MASFFENLFGGGAEKEAAEKNRAALGQYNTTSLAALDAGLNRATGAVTGARDAAGNYLDRNYGLYGDLRNTGTGILNSGRTGQLNALDPALKNYEALQSKYGAGTDLYLDSLGVRGAEGNRRAVDSFQAGPGYQFTLDQGLQALNRRRAAAGMLNSGNADVDALTYGTGLANQTYGDWQSQLAGLINPELAAASGATGVRNNISDVIGQDALARLGLEQAVAQGQAGVNTQRAANEIALGNSLSGLYTGDAQNRVGVAGNVVSGNMAANNLQAQGESQGARNLLNAGLNLASLAAGGFGGGGGSFGSFFGGGMPPDYGQASNVAYGGQRIPVFGRGS
ncbi:hypothetical protein [Bradyrhizobium sp. LHD-71]|uniref:hypothetical protein n=1 Tax=Bradyrhizobium sp. LHD-71 TaxID=3072141 RepID=UPI00280F38D8|nr:hypothetical protein [Bradyrhizobium sp. LHD-71]MDQ8730504.1 hypothetical protein [Bradyrhizobium sp. LHD-71]